MNQTIRAALKDERGGVAIQMAVLALPLSVLAFGVLDINRASVAKRELQDALDAATLMAARSSATSNAALQTVGAGALTGQLADQPILKVDKSSFKLEGAKVVSTASLKVKPIIANLWLGGDMTVGAASEVVRGMNKLEVVLVLDNTGSMAGSKLTNLKTAAKNLIDTLSAASARSTEANAIQIGIVPFSQTVKIGSTYKSQNWMDKNAASPIHSEIFTGSANRFTLLSNMGQSWGGCVESRPQPYDVQDTGPTTSTPATLIVPYFWPDEPDTPSKSSSKNGDFGTFENDYLVDGTYSKTSWKVPQGATAKYSKSPSGSGKGPNRGCDMQPLMRMTTDWTALKKLVTDMNATGNTNIGLGAMWGWHLLSPNAPFGDGVPYGTPKTTKIAIIMTDGDNVFGSAKNDNGSPYNGMGYIWQNRLGTTSVDKAADKMDARLELLCDNMTAKKIVVYTVRVEVKSGSSTLLSGCATSADKFYDVQDASELNSVFQTIAGDIASMRISR